MFTSVLRLICLSSVVLFGALSTQAEDKSKEDPIVGRWRWFNDRIYVFHADGTVTPDTGKWKCIQSSQTPRKYELTWGKGVFVDTLRLEKNATALEGKNEQGVKVSAVRLKQ